MDCYSARDPDLRSSQGHGHQAIAEGMHGEGLSVGHRAVGLVSESGEPDVGPYPAGVHEGHHRATNRVATGSTQLGVGDDVEWRNFDLEVSDLAVKERRGIVDTDESDLLPAWSLNGQEIAFVRSNPAHGGAIGIYRIGVNAEEERELVSFGIPFCTCK